jgi:hypothetical protein
LNKPADDVTELLVGGVAVREILTLVKKISKRSFFALMLFSPSFFFEFFQAFHQ